MTAMERFGGKQLPHRLEDQRFLTGEGRYSDDLDQPGQAHLAVLRSPHAHAALRSIDTAAAAAMPGVLAVLTGAGLAADGVDPLAFMAMFKRPDGTPMTAPPRRALALERVRYVGEPVAAVVATTRAQAIEAAEAIAVDYEPLPAVVDLQQAASPGAPVVWDAAPDNIAAAMRHGDKDAVDRAFAAAAHVVTLDIVNQRLVANPMEPRATLAAFDSASGRLTLYAGAQNPTALKQALSQAILKLPPEKVRVLVHDIGGGFGMRAGLYPEDAVVAYAARKLGRAVKWRADRAEDFLATTHARDQIARAGLALDGEGRILGLRIEILANAGAYLAGATAIIPLVLTPKVAVGVYRIPAIDIDARLVLTNAATISAYRGAGRPEGVFIIERLMDTAAAQLKLDPAEIRRRNFVPKAAMPFKTAMAETYDSGDFAHFLDGAIARSDWDGFAARRRAAEARGRRLGRGLAYYIEWTGAGQFTETVDVIAEAEGRVVVQSATQAMGQGLETSYTQLVAARLGVPPEQIRIVQGDTDLVAGFGSMGSRSLFVGGSAIVDGADQFVAHAKGLAAEALEASAADIAYAEGRFAVAGTDVSIGLFELAGRQQARRIALKTSHTVGGVSWPNGCHICELELDPETGAVEITRYTAYDDVGNAINRTLVQGQVHGGIVQGAGQALMEGCVYDRDSGQLLTGSYMDYAMPRAADFPLFDQTIDESVPCATNLLGAKGAGESGTVGATPAVVNALMDALRPFGVANFQMPATPLRVWQAIQAAKANG
jgi:carbon-monoxide dehydrogenase large subunit